MRTFEEPEMLHTEEGDTITIIDGRYATPSFTVVDDSVEPQFLMQANVNAIRKLDPIIFSYDHFNAETTSAKHFTKCGS